MFASIFDTSTALRVSAPQHAGNDNTTVVHGGLDVLAFTDATHDIPVWIQARFTRRLGAPPDGMARIVGRMDRWLEDTACSELRKVRPGRMEALARCLAAVRVCVFQDGTLVCSHAIAATPKAATNLRCTSEIKIRDASLISHCIGKGGAFIKDVRERVPGVRVMLCGLVVCVTADTQLGADTAAGKMRTRLAEIAAYNPLDSALARREAAGRREAEERERDAETACERRALRVARKKRRDGPRDKRRVHPDRMRAPRGRKAFVSGRCCDCE